MTWKNYLLSYSLNKSTLNLSIEKVIVNYSNAIEKCAQLRTRFIKDTARITTCNTDVDQHVYEIIYTINLKNRSQ